MSVNKEIEIWAADPELPELAVSAVLSISECGMVSVSAFGADCFNDVISVVITVFANLLMENEVDPAEFLSDEVLSQFKVLSQFEKGEIH